MVIPCRSHQWSDVCGVVYPIVRGKRSEVVEGVIRRWISAFRGVGGTNYRQLLVKQREYSVEHIETKIITDKIYFAS